MDFRLVPKSVTLNNLEQRNGPCFALFHRIRGRCRRKKVHIPNPILHCFRDIAFDGSKIAIFGYPSCV